jgi:hypothetical protein
MSGPQESDVFFHTGPPTHCTLQLLSHGRRAIPVTTTAHLDLHRAQRLTTALPGRPSLSLRRLSTFSRVKARCQNHQSPLVPGGLDRIRNPDLGAKTKHSCSTADLLHSNSHLSSRTQKVCLALRWCSPQARRTSWSRKLEICSCCASQGHMDQLLFNLAARGAT